MELTSLVDDALREIEAAEDENALVQVRARILGKNGSLSLQLRELGKLPADERAERGQQLNVAKKQVEAAVAERQGALRGAAQAERLSTERVDISLPACGPVLGHAHPLRQIEDELIEIFDVLGFEWVDGREVESEHYNFDALNIPADHPAREMQDTFFVSDGVVLRTHTSPVQIHTMENREAPLRIITTGRVYRHDKDTSHSPMFHQLEGFLVNDDVTFVELKGVLYEVLRSLFGQDVEMRFRKNFFPFTEPSGEIDIRRANSWGGRWMEILGCGMIHPNVLRNVGYDPEACQGFAFGMGIDRIAMLKYGIDEIRALFDNDQRVLNHF